MHVHGACAAEVVVSPYLAENLFAGEDASGVAEEETQELELLECEVQGPLAGAGRVVVLVDDDARGAQGGGFGGRSLSEREPHPGIDLGRSRSGQQQITETPLGGERAEAPLRDDDEDGDSAGGEKAAGGASGGEILARIDENDLVGRRDGRGVEGGMAHPVRQEFEGGEGVRSVLGCQEEELRHRIRLPRVRMRPIIMLHAARSGRRRANGRVCAGYADRVSETVPVPPTSWAGVLPIWMLALIASVVLGMVAPGGLLFAWTSVAGALAVLVSFVVQVLIVGRAEGFLVRVSASVVGSLAIFFIASLIFAVVGADR